MTIRKERFIGLRVTDTEYRQIERKAKKAKMNILVDRYRSSGAVDTACPDIRYH